MRVVISFILLLSVLTAATAQPNPDTLWTRTYGDEHYDYCSSVCQTSDSGYILAGRRHSNRGEYNYNDASILKTDNGGQLLWETRNYFSDYDCFLIRSSEARTADMLQWAAVRSGLGEAICWS